MIAHCLVPFLLGTKKLAPVTVQFFLHPLLTLYSKPTRLPRDRDNFCYYKINTVLGMHLKVLLSSMQSCHPLPQMLIWVQILRLLFSGMSIYQLSTKKNKKKSEYALRLHMSQKAFFWLFVLSSVTLIILSFFLEPSTYLLVQQARVLVAESWIHWSLRELQARYGFSKLIPQHCWTSYELLPAANKLSQADGKAVSQPLSTLAMSLEPRIYTAQTDSSFCCS